MKIWFDILTPKQLLFFEPMIGRLKRGNRVLCTSRAYGEVVSLARIRRFPVRSVGRHGGAGRLEKLKASTSRIGALSGLIPGFSPDLTVSFCSPEASRVSHGLGIDHIAFNDSPHHTAAMKLTVPLVQRLLIPWVIPKSEFARFGIDPRNIIQYRAIDAAVLARRTAKRSRPPFDHTRRTILVRLAEDQAAYVDSKHDTALIIREILKHHGAENIVVLSRYASQKKDLTREFGRGITVLDMSHDGKILLEGCDVFVGSGGTMTAESALLGVPTISFGAVPSIIEQYLVRKKLIVLQRSPARIARTIGRMLSSGSTVRPRAQRLLASMEDPYDALTRAVRSLQA